MTEDDEARSQSRGSGPPGSAIMTGSQRIRTYLGVDIVELDVPQSHSVSAAARRPWRPGARRIRAGYG